MCDGSIFGDAAELIVSRKGTINWRVNAPLGSRILYTIYLVLGMTSGQCPIYLVSTLIFTLTYFSTSSSLFSHHDAGTGAETLLPVTEPSQPAPRRTVYSILLGDTLSTVSVLVISAAVTLLPPNR